MASIAITQKVIKKLYDDYIIKGYVTEEHVLNIIIDNDLPLDEVDYVCDYLLSMGVIIRDTSIEKTNDEEENYDRSKINYGKLFQEVEEIDKSLAPFIEEVRQIKPPQHREFQNLIQQAKNNNPFAKKRIIEMSLRSVIRMAMWYHKKYQTPLAETIQEGCVGLIVALGEYIISKQNTFSTYAPWWIRLNIIRAAPSLNPLIHFSVSIKDKLFSIYDILNQCSYCNKYYCNKTCSEVLKAVSKKLSCSEVKAEEYINYFNTFESFDELMERDESIFDNCTADEDQLFAEIINKEMKKALSKMLQTLEPREEKVILLRFGFRDGKQWTLREIGNELGVTRERIRQIEKKAFERLRHKSNCQILKCFIE